jgi:hypothetical protein
MKTAKLNVSDAINRISTDSSITNACLLICCPVPIDGCAISIDVMSLVESIDISMIKYIFIVRFGGRLSYLDGTKRPDEHFEILKNVHYEKCNIS